MNSSMLWNPIRDIDALLHKVSGGPAPQTFRDNSNTEMPAWTPLVDVLENAKGYILYVELPGVRKEEVKLTVENNILTLQGERSEPASEEIRPRRVERARGRFFRVFQLSEDADTTKIHASMNDGVMEIHIAKREEALPRHIEVKIN